MHDEKSLQRSCSLKSCFLVTAYCIIKSNSSNKPETTESLSCVLENKYQVHTSNKSSILETGSPSHYEDAAPSITVTTATGKITDVMVSRHLYTDCKPDKTHE